MKKISLIAHKINDLQPLSSAIIPCMYTITKERLTLTFDLTELFKIDPHIAWDHHTKKGKRSHYLWESTCLELFIGCKNTTMQGSPYVEINVSPSGEWNIYQFNDYRTPDTMPPQIADIPADTLHISCPHKDSYATYQRTLTIHLSSIHSLLTHSYEQPVKTNEIFINITAVVCTPSQTFYFAKQHTTPADFHQQKYWYRP